MKYLLLGLLAMIHFNQLTLAAEPAMTIIAHPSVPVNQLSINEVKNIYLLKSNNGLTGHLLLLLTVCQAVKYAIVLNRKFWVLRLKNMLYISKKCTIVVFHYLLYRNPHRRLLPSYSMYPELSRILKIYRIVIRLKFCWL
jgi:hypothetical protein